jgi:filamentous hemagglutinin family protein
MTPLYRLVWSLSQQPLTALFKSAPPAEQGGRAVRQSIRIFAVSVLTFGAGLSWGLPEDGQVAGGQASVSQNGSTLTVEQTSQQAIINWQSFGIAASETVNFNQLGASSVALNRITGSAASEIYGHLNANGQVFLVNANGVYFAPGAQVNVGGLVASTLNISDSDFLSNNFHFAGDSTASISNQGSLTAAEGGYIAFLGREVTNSGTVTTPGGTAALGAGSAVDVTLAGNQLLSFKVSGEALAALAENGGLIQADGGKVILRAQAKDALLQTVVNNTGVIRAQTIANQNGSIVLLGGQSGTTQVAGTLDASAPNGGHGGFIETSGTHLKVADGATITTKSSTDQDGQWLIDPYDFTVATSNGDISGYTLSTALGNGHVTIQTTDTAANCSKATCAAGNSSGNGDIFVNDTVSWSANTLTLDAWRNIDINVPMNGSNTAGLALKYGQGSTTGTIAGKLATYNINAPVNLASAGSFSTQLGIHGTVDTYTIITSLGSEGSTSTTDLQGINGGLSANYVLGTNIDATATSGWNSNAGFVPLGNSQIKFTGSFDGLGHTISALTINRPTISNVGLFGYTESAVVKNIGLVGGNITGFYYVGGLVGKAAGVTQAPPMFAFPGMFFPGMPGMLPMPAQPVTPPNNTKISNVFATGNIKGHGYLGGLVGDAINTDISNAYATGSVSGTGDRLGGLVGRAVGGTISNAYATGNVSGSASGTQFGNVISGPLVADVSFTTIMTNGYWNSTASVAGNTSGTSLTAEKMSKQSSFDGFDFGTVWTIHEGHSTPLLRSFLTPLTLKYSGGDKVRTYSGDTFAVSARYSINGADTSGHLFGLDYDGAVNVGSYSANLWSDQEGYIITAFGSNDLTITPADLTVSGSRSYDTTTLVSGAVLTATGVNNEVFNVTGSGHASNLSSANVQTDSVLASVTGLGLGVSTNGGLAANYTALKAAGSKVSITKAKLTLSDLILSGSRIYDGTTVVSGDVLTATGVNNEVFNVTGSGHASNLSSANVQTDSVLASVTGLGLGISANGGNATNYTALNTKDSKVSIIPAELKLSGSRLYDASTLVLGDVLTATGVNNETFSVIGSGHASNLSSANVQTDSVLASLTGLGLGISANGGNATNYTALKAAGSVVSITPAELKLSGSRLYDASKIVSGAVLTATGVNNETFSVTGSGDASNLSSANVQTDSVLASVTGLGLGISTNGGLATNYTALKAAGSKVSITKAKLTLSDLILSGSRIYDGTTVVSGDVLTATGVKNQTFSVTGSGHASNLSSANVQTDSVLASLTGLGLGISANGGDAKNYTALNTKDSKVSITPADITLSGSDVTKSYDATTSALGSAVKTSGKLFGSDSINHAGLSYAFSDANAGSNKTVNVSGSAAISDGNSGNNYAVTFVDSTASAIQKADLTLSGSRTYDGTTVVLSDVLAANGVNNETFSVTGDGDASNLRSDNVQTDSVLASLTGLVLGSSTNGGLVGNYTPLKAAGSKLSITPAALALSGSRTYDGTTVVPGYTLTATGVNNETFSVTGSGDASNLRSEDIQADSVLTSVIGLGLGVSTNGGLVGNYTPLKAPGSSVSITNLIGRRVMGITNQTMESGSSTVNAGASSSLDPDASYKRRHGRNNRANVKLDVIFERDVTAN